MRVSIFRQDATLAGCKRQHADAAARRTHPDQKGTAPAVSAAGAEPIYLLRAALASSTTWAKSSFLYTARSASTLRLRAMPATFRPCMKRL